MSSYDGFEMMRRDLERGSRFTQQRVDFVEQDVALAQEDANQALAQIDALRRQLAFERWSWTCVFALQIVFDAWVVFGDHLVWF